MPPLSTTYNPAQVLLGSGGKATAPYLPAKPPSQSTAAPTTIGPQAVRATGAGPFDQAYRQNLATYAGGLFTRPGGGMSFNPTDPASFPGQATGGGTAPVIGMPTTLLSQALGGQPFSSPPPAAPSSQGNLQQQGDNQWWLRQYLGQGGAFGMPSLGAAYGNRPQSA